jgi:Ca2+-binding protein (EF-Hand superfamily)
LSCRLPESELPAAGTCLPCLGGLYSGAHGRRLKAINPEFSDAEITAVMDAADSNKDGNINYAEFGKWVFVEKIHWTAGRR